MGSRARDPIGATWRFQWLAKVRGLAGVIETRWASVTFVGMSARRAEAHWKRGHRDVRRWEVYGLVKHGRKAVRRG